MQSRSPCAIVITEYDSGRYLGSQYSSGVLVITTFKYRRTCKTFSTPNVKQQPNSKHQCSCSTLHMATSYKTLNFTRTAVRIRRMTRTTFTAQICTLSTRIWCGVTVLVRTKRRYAWFSEYT